MASNNFFRSDLPGLHHVVQNSMVLFPKEIVIATLRDHFSKDSYYHYVKDEWGFPKTPDHTDLPGTSGLRDNVTTRLFIGEAYRQDIVYYPSVIVRHSGARSTPLSFNREGGAIQYGYQEYTDGYNTYQFRTPLNFLFAGAWEGTISVDVFTRSLYSRDHLCEEISILFTDIEQSNLERSGFFVKSVEAGAGTETDDRNDKVYRTTITLSYRSEWRRHIPIGNVVEVINFAVDFGVVGDPDYPVSPNLEVNTEKTLLQFLEDLET